MLLTDRVSDPLYRYILFSQRDTSVNMILSQRDIFLNIILSQRDISGNINIVLVQKHNRCSTKHISQSQNLLLLMQSYPLRKCHCRDALFSYCKRESAEAGQVQLEYISESRNLFCFCRYTLLLNDNFNGRDHLFGY